MGILADIYIARDEDAVRYDTTPDSFAADRFEFKGFTDLELSTLWAIVRGIEWDVAMMDDFVKILEEDGGGRIIARLPAPMVEHFAQMALEQMRDAATKWADTEELRCSPDDILPVITGLADLALELWRVVGRYIFGIAYEADA